MQISVKSRQAAENVTARATSPTNALTIINPRKLTAPIFGQYRQLDRRTVTTIGANMVKGYATGCTKYPMRTARSAVGAHASARIAISIQGDSGSIPWTPTMVIAAIYAREMIDIPLCSPTLSGAPPVIPPSWADTLYKVIWAITASEVSKIANGMPMLAGFTVTV